MLFIIFTSLALISTGLFVYFIEYLGSGILWWSIPLVFVACWIVILLLFILFLTISLIGSPRKKSVAVPKRFYSYFTYQVAKLLQFLYNVEIVLENQELIPENKKFLLVSNHQSNLDPIMLVSAFKNYPLTYIMKNNIMKVPFVGRWLYASGFFPLDRKNDRKALEVIIQGVKRLQKGYPLAVFPEGTRSKGPKVNEFRNGIFKVAQKSESPILVVALDGFYKVKKRFPFKKTKLLMRICEYIPYEEFANVHTNEIGDRVRDLIINNQIEAREKYEWLK